MKLKTKIWFLLGTLMFAVLLVDLSTSYHKLSGELRAEAEADASMVYGMMMATRRVYQRQFIDSGLPINDHTVGFLPAHSFSRISKDFTNWSNSGIIFNNVSDIARNRANLADRFELEAMQWFRSNPDADTHVNTIRTDAGVRYLLHTNPIRIEASCLKCHGDEEDAPLSIRKQYDTGYHYRVGDLRGVVSIKIPMARLDARLNEIWGEEITKNLVGYLILFVALGLILDRFVLHRLAKLQVGAERIATGDYAARVAVYGDDELSGLATSLNDMAAAVENRNQILSKLSSAVEQSPADIIITDLAGNIEYVNTHFMNHTGYTHADVIGHNPRLLKSGLTSAESYQALWETLLNRKTWHGELSNRRKDGSIYTCHTLIAPIHTADGTIINYLGIEEDITEKKRTQEQVYQLAFYDTLTDLPNRTLLLDRLAQTLPGGRHHDRFDVLILINLDRFKTINDARGHSLGNAVLEALARRLSEGLRDSDTLARLGGDEFALLLPDLARRPELASHHALSVADKIHAILRDPLAIGDEEVIISASLGITISSGAETESPEDMLRRAGTALHRAKAAGGNQTRFFEISMGETAEQRFQVERELRRAIGGDELRLFLQPQVDHAARVTGAEVLVRWQHPERGLLAPDMFIPLAEESDLIVQLGIWVLTESCVLMARENAAGNPLHLAINISPRHFRQDHFVPWLRDLLVRTGADPTHITLEVTEGLMIDDLNAMIIKMSELTALGIELSVDDFGTGYSSLAYLKRLPIQELKIDRSFVQDAPSDADDAALIDTILAVAEHMHLRVVAEGVETTEHAAFLDARAVAIRQGYLYGKPEPAATWLAYWRDQRENAANAR